MIISIDSSAGFCAGVRKAINTAEQLLENNETVYSLGHILHNPLESNRLENLGLKVIDHEEFRELKNATVLIRAHGEPPGTYQTAKSNNLSIADATCPVVLNLQHAIGLAHIEMQKLDGQVVIFGKANHPEVKGLVGQAEHQAIIIGEGEGTDKIDLSRPIRLYAQTTMDPEAFNRLKENLSSQIKDGISFHAYDSTCKIPVKRKQHLIKFAKEQDAMIFVSGKDSSNGRFLFSQCQLANPCSYFVSSSEQLNNNWFNNVRKLGISGSASTPVWLMQEIAETINKLTS